MKLLTTLAIALLSLPVFAQADGILGVWFNEEKDGKIEVYKKGNAYFGKIIWLEDNTNDDGSSPRLDKNNDDPKKQKLPIIGLEIVKNLEWDEDDQEWDDGEIYDPKSGNNYSAYAKLENPD